MDFKKFAGVAAAGALAASIGLASPASAQNYAPGLPPAQQGVPNNPPAAAPIVPTVVLVPAAVADNEPARVMRNPVGNRIGAAPKVRGTVSTPIPLVVNGLENGSRYLVFIKRPGEEYGTLGTVIGSPFSALPVFEVSRPGTTVIAMKDVVTGETRYVKVRVRR
mgnify:FL=1